MDGQYYEVEVEALGGAPVLTAVTPKAAPALAGGPGSGSGSGWPWAPVSTAAAASQQALAVGTCPSRPPCQG